MRLRYSILCISIFDVVSLCGCDAFFLDAVFTARCYAECGDATVSRNNGKENVQFQR